MADEPYKKKLIEVALPLEAINREAAREKSIRHGHPSTLHLWWARRPLAACRAVLFAQLVDDPSARPDEFPTEDLQEKERERLFEIIERLVKWENSSNEAVLEEARAEIRRCFDGEPPPVLDPFAGGGSIPLEAQRLGLRAYATDLNPVAVLINKALVEIPPRWVGIKPVNPDGSTRLDTDAWAGPQGLAEDVRYYGQWMRKEAERRIGSHYPKAKLSDGTSVPVIAWIWSRTVGCPNPACRAMVPLVRSFWLGKKRGKEAWVNPIVEGKRVRFEIGHAASGPPIPGTVERSGATCLVCGESFKLSHVRTEAQAGRLSAQLMAIVAAGSRTRLYVAPNELHELAADVPRPDDVPDQLVTTPSHDVDRLPMYGMPRWSDAFTSRQLLMLSTLSDLIAECRARIEADTRAAGWSAELVEAYATDLVTYLGLAVSRTADLNNSIVTWSSSRDQARNLFARQAIPMAWDYVEVNPFGDAAGDLGVSVDTAARTLAGLVPAVPATAYQREASVALREMPGVVISTDPPYYDNIGYADLADFFYVWLRRSLKGEYPELLATMLTPKTEELVATAHRFGGSRSDAEEFFRKGFVDVMAAAASSMDPSAPMAVFYAFKQAEGDDEGVASTGWETMLEGLLAAGLAVTATWPVRTERSARSVGIGTNALASSIVLACRPRPAAAGITDRRGFLQALRTELPSALREMQQGSIAPVDLAQSSIGPGMAVFSRHAKVVEPSGDPMRVRAALGLINQVLDEVLAEQEGDFDAETRWAIKWFSQYGFDEGPFGDAETLCKATGTAINGMQRSGIVATKAPKVWLVSREDLPDGWDPATDDRVPVWEATQQLVKALAEGGEASAAALLARLGGLGETARELAYRLYSICERKGWAKEAGAYNALAVSWLDIQRLASADAPAANEQGSLL